ncbi:MAG: MATE family efflux transporter [Maledivibacter sp.]|jgi:putative MATE family efflux protein|nr:MATE family efflux transporter [Maledivibacter sp.]
MNEMRQELLEKSPWDLMIKLSLPAIIGMLVIGLYSFVDAIFVGQLVGANALGAISVAYPFTLFNSGIATLVGIGSASILSRAIGKKDNETIDKIMGNLLVMVLILSVIVTLIGTIFADKLLLISGAEGEMFELAVRYLKIIFLGSFFVNFAQSANMIMRGEGLMKRAMGIMAAGAILNIILDPIFIKVFGLGIEGAAIATIVSQIIQAIITMYYFIKISETVRFHGIRISKELIPEILSIGVSAMLMQIMSFVQQTVLYNVTSQYGGNEQVILMGASLRVLMFSFIPLWGMSQGLQPIIGTNYGAKLYDRVKKVANTFMVGSIVISLLFWLPIQIIPKQVLALFIKDISIVEKGVGSFRLMYSIFPVLGIFIISVTFFQALGKGSKAGILVMLRQVVVFIPTVIFLPRLMHMLGVWISIPITDGIVLLVAISNLLMEYRRLEDDRKELLI